MEVDWADRTILKIARKYTDHEVISGLNQIVSNLNVELGKLKSEVQHLEHQNEILCNRLSKEGQLKRKLKETNLERDILKKERDQYYNWYLNKPRPEEKVRVQGFGFWACRFNCGCIQISKHRGRLHDTCTVHREVSKSKFKLSNKMRVGYIVYGLNEEE